MSSRAEILQAFELAERILATGRIEGNDLVITPSANARGSVRHPLSAWLLVSTPMADHGYRCWKHIWMLCYLTGVSSESWTKTGSTDTMHDVSASYFQLGLDSMIQLHWQLWSNVKRVKPGEMVARKIS